MVKGGPVNSKGITKGAWSREEDEKLRAYVQRFGHWNWRQLPKFAGLSRCGKSCRLRWMNYLRPGLKRGNFSKEEDDLILAMHEELGNKWSKIAASLPGRTDNEIKNHWHSHLKKLGKQQRQLVLDDEKQHSTDTNIASSQQTISSEIEPADSSLASDTLSQQPASVDISSCAPQEATCDVFSSCLILSDQASMSGTSCVSEDYSFLASSADGELNLDFWDQPFEPDYDQVGYPFSYASYDDSFDLLFQMMAAGLENNQDFCV